MKTEMPDAFFLIRAHMAMHAPRTNVYTHARACASTLARNSCGDMILQKVNRASGEHEDHPAVPGAGLWHIDTKLSGPRA